MSLATIPDRYSLSVCADGTYEDKIPSFHLHPNGIICPCNNKCYSTRTSMANHTRTDNHKKYVEAQNSNITNHAAELENARQEIKDHKHIIARMERTIAGLERDKLDLFRTINLLTNMTTPRTSAAPDLMNFD